MRDDLLPSAQLPPDGGDRRELIALLHLASPALPIGGFSYSQGLEAAIERGLITDGDSAGRWIRDALSLTMAQAEAPLWVIQYGCWQRHDASQLARWNDWFLSTRETREFRLETEQMGWSLAQLIEQMQWGEPTRRQTLMSMKPLALPTAFSAAAVALSIGRAAGLAAYLFSWAENQVAAALKAVPLGQVAGQRILASLHSVVPTVVDEALQRADADPPRLSTLATQLGLLSARHETQYSRLFRS